MKVGGLFVVLLGALIAMVAALALSCDQGGTALPVPAQVQTVDLGANAVATLGSDGSFSIVQGGTTLVATTAGAPLFNRTSDPDDPDGWHDPTSPDSSLTVLPVDLTTVSAESVDDGSSTKAIHLVVPAQPGDTALLSVSLAADDGFYTGLGEQFAHVSASGRVTPLFLTIGGSLESDTNEAHVPVPFLVSSRGWGVFVATREAGAFDVGSTDPQVVTGTFEGRTLDVWFFVDPDPLALVARYNRLAGRPRPLPRWALSLIHWRHWASQDDVISIATEYRTRHIPTSALWFDDGWQTSMNDYTLSPAMFGDTQAMMAQIAALGYRVMAWTSPYLEKPKGAPADPAQQLYVQGAQGGDLVQDGDGNVYDSPAAPIKASTANGAGVPDVTGAGGQALWENDVATATRSNIHGFKCDYGEDFIPNLGNARFPVAFADGMTSTTAGRVFPIEWHATDHAVLDAAFPGDGALIVRASSWGGASQADMIWPGDLDAQFEHQGDVLPGGSIAVGGLPAVVVDAQTLAVSGFPAFGSDTTGYRGTPTRESTLRWMEHTALTVVMQVYEDGDRLPWLYDDVAAAEYQAMATLHQQLEPYNAILVTGSQTSGAPTLRPLPLAFPGDPATFAVADAEYMLGPDLLVAPVITAGATNDSVHLPPGQWVHWWSDQVYTGPTDVTVDAPLGSPPLFARAGGLVPMLPADIDTLVDASAPGVVTLASQATEMQGRAWAMGASSVVLDDGAAIAVNDAADGVTVTWTAGASVTNLTLDLDLRVRANGASGATPAAVATLTGGTLAPMASPAALAGSPTPAWAPGNPGHVSLRFVGSGAARVP